MDGWPVLRMPQYDGMFKPLRPYLLLPPHDANEAGACFGAGDLLGGAGVSKTPPSNECLHGLFVCAHTGQRLHGKGDTCL